MQDVMVAPVGQEYDLEYLLKNPNIELTPEQWDICMRMTNNDKSAADVNIGPAAERYNKKMRETGTYW